MSIPTVQKTVSCRTRDYYSLTVNQRGEIRARKSIEIIVGILVNSVSSIESMVEIKTTFWNVMKRKAEK
jgi:hypothetical protein